MRLFIRICNFQSAFTRKNVATYSNTNDIVVLCTLEQFPPLSAQNHCNHNGQSEERKISQRANQDLKTSKLPEARENAGDQVVIGFSFVSDWSRERREFSKPITERSKAKPMQSEITFNTQLKLTQRSGLCSA